MVGDHLPMFEHRARIHWGEDGSSEAEQWLLWQELCKRLQAVIDEPRYAPIRNERR